MQILINPFVAKYIIELDAATGLSKEVHATSFFVNAKKREIIVTWDLVLVSPTGAVMAIVGSGEYVRTGLSYDGLENSPIGAGIIAMISNTLAAYPNL